MYDNKDEIPKNESSTQIVVKILWYTFLFFGGTILLYYAGFLGDNSNAPGIRESSQRNNISSSPSPLYNAPNTIPSPSKQAPSFGGYDCTSDCSGHEAGYAWAEDNQKCDTSYSNGSSESFNEGVRAWAEENCYTDEYYEEGYY